MPTHLDTLRAINARASAMSVFSKVDADLDAEAGMDGNYARQLQAARNLDAPAANPIADVDLAARVLRHLVSMVLAADVTGESVEEVSDLHVLVDLARLALTPDAFAQAERAGHDLAAAREAAR